MERTGGYSRNYAYPLAPGPTSVPEAIRKAYESDYIASDLDPRYFEQYRIISNRLQKHLDTNSDIVIMTGEAMAVLWGAIKSVVLPGNHVFTFGTGAIPLYNGLVSSEYYNLGCRINSNDNFFSKGYFGDGFGDMARALGCIVESQNYDWEYPHIGNKSELEHLKERIESFGPKLVIAVHCETPTGTLLNSIPDIGKIAQGVGALFCVDMVSSFGGVPIHVDDWKIDLGLFGSQKCLNCHPEFCMATISKNAWHIIEQVRYVGYDALLQFKTALKCESFPYTPSWTALVALNATLDMLDTEGWENVYMRHIQAQKYTIGRLDKMGLRPFVSDPNLASPTVTSCWVPEDWTWKILDQRLRERGVLFGGTYGKLIGKIFRIGHMGSQANMNMLEKALDILEQVISDKEVLVKR